MKVVFFGDSVTAGYFESREKMHGITDFEAVYHNRLKILLEEKYPDKNFDFINAGVGGETAENALLRLANVIQEKPDITVVCFGLNDVNQPLSSYRNSLQQIFDILKPHCTVIYMTPNMLNTYVSDKIEGEGLKKYAAVTAEYQNSGVFDNLIECGISTAQKCGVYVCDCYGEWKTMSKSGTDITGLLANYINHPKREMHMLFANKLFEVLCAYISSH